MADEVLEFAKAYEYCFFKVPIKSPNEARSFLLTRISRNPDLVQGKLITRGLSEKAQSYEFKEFMASAEPLIPTAGYVHCTLERPTAVYLSLDPQRQYRKALYFEHNGLSYLPNGSKTLANFLAINRTGEFDTLLKAYAHQLALGKPPYSTIRSALDLVDSGEAHSCPVSRFFAVSLTKGLKVPCLWHKNTKEGVFINKQLYVTNKLMPFKEFFLKKWDMLIRPISEAPRTSL